MKEGVQASSQEGYSSTIDLSAEAVILWEFHGVIYFTLKFDILFFFLIWKKSWCWERLKGEGGGRGRDG